MIFNCPKCGSYETVFLGIDDGATYGDELCEFFECLECGEQFEGSCIEIEFEDELDEE